MSDLPKAWRKPWVLGLIVLSVAGVLAAEDARMTTIAERATKAAWNSQFQAIALNACTTAASNATYAAVTDSLEKLYYPLRDRLTAHESLDGQRVSDLTDRVERTESLIDGIPGRMAKMRARERVQFAPPVPSPPSPKREASYSHPIVIERRIP